MSDKGERKRETERGEEENGRGGREENKWKDGLGKEKGRNDDSKVEYV